MQTSITLNGASAKWFLTNMLKYGDEWNVINHFNKMEQTLKEQQSQIDTLKINLNSALDQNIAIGKLSELEAAIETLALRMDYYSAMIQTNYKYSDSHIKILNQFKDIIESKINLLPNPL